jgi:hypothetical protein
VFRRTVRIRQLDGTLEPPYPCGWEQVQDLLTARADCPVVLSCSIDGGFPDMGIARWRPPPGTDLTPAWAARDPAGWGELSESAKGEYREERAGELWDALPAAVQWQHAMAGLAAMPGYRQFDPSGWAAYRFGHGLSCLDLAAADWEDRLSAVFSR